MECRTLTITVRLIMTQALRTASKAAQASVYQGETFSRETPEMFLGRITSRRWVLMGLLMGAGALSVRELARRAGRDVAGVRQDVGYLEEHFLVERTASGGVRCPCVDIHVDMHFRKTG